MTIRLLATYDSFPPQSILTLAPAIEAALIADGNASATLTGGTVAYRERAPVMIQPAVQKHGSVALIANRKAIVPLSEGTALTITPTVGTTGTYQRYDAAGAAVGGLMVIGATPLTVGAYEGDQTVEIKCTTGTMVVKVRDAALGAATSGGSIPLIAAPPAALSSLALCGNSRMSMGHSQTLGSYSQGHVGWFNELMAMNGLCGFDVVYQFAVAGKTMSEIISDQLPPLLACDAECAWFTDFLNSLNGSLADNYTFAQMVAALTTWVTALAAKFKIVVIDSCDPIAQTGVSGSKQRAFSIPALNAALEQICSKFYNVIYNDTYQYMLDPASANLDPYAAYMLTDGAHYQSVGGQVKGYGSFRNFGRKLQLTKYKTSSANLLPAFYGTGGTVTGGGFITVTGTPPAGWEIIGKTGVAATNSCTITQIAPNMMRFVFANIGAGASIQYIQKTGLGASFAAGDVVQGQFDFQASGIAGVNRLEVLLNRNNNLFLRGMGPSPDEPTVSYPTKAHSGRRSTPPITLPVGTPVTSFEFAIDVSLAPGGTLTLDVMTPDLRKLT